MTIKHYHWLLRNFLIQRSPKAIQARENCTFGVMELVEVMQPGGAKVNISWFFGLMGPLFRFFEAFGG